MADQIAIINSGGANIASVLYAFERLGVSATLTTDADTIRSAARVVLPGVGAAADAMQRLKEADLIDVIRSLRQPVLGVCLGMQLMLEGSEEEDTDCLGLIPGRATRLPVQPEFPVPNMGWCALQPQRDHPILKDLDSNSYCYFVHSYAAPVSDSTLASASHAVDFSAIIARDNFVAAQFHPERSSLAGARLLANFLAL